LQGGDRLSPLAGLCSPLFLSSYFTEQNKRKEKGAAGAKGPGAAKPLQRKKPPFRGRKKAERPLPDTPLS